MVLTIKLWEMPIAADSDKTSKYVECPVCFLAANYMYMVVRDEDSRCQVKGGVLYEEVRAARFTGYILECGCLLPRRDYSLVCQRRDGILGRKFIPKGES